MDPEIMGGALVVVGTRVPVGALLDYLQRDDARAIFLAGLPTVQRDQAVAALDIAREALKESGARSSG